VPIVFSQQCHPQATLRAVKGKSDKDLEYEFIVTKDIWSPFDHTFQVSQPTGAPKGAPPRVPTVSWSENCPCGFSNVNIEESATQKISVDRTRNTYSHI
jgi:hypothetical protein